VIKTDKWGANILKPQIILYSVLHFFSSVFGQNNLRRTLFQPPLFGQRGKIYKQFKTKIKGIDLFVLIATYFERTREGKLSVQLSRISSH